MVIASAKKCLFLFQCRETTQGKDVVPLSIVHGPQDWVASDFTGEANAYKWQYCLTAEDIAEIEAALIYLKGRGVEIEVIWGHR